MLLFTFGIIVALILMELTIRLFVPVRNVGPSFSEFDPVYGKRHKKNFSCERITPEFTMRFTTNSHGFRGPELHDNPSGTILFLGDSFTEGYGVNDGEEFPALVRKAVNQTSVRKRPVVNAGTGDTGNGRSLRFLRTEASRYTPHLIVLQLTQNDFEDNMLDEMFAIDSAGTLIELPAPQPTQRRLIQSVIESIPGLQYSYLIGFARDVAWSLHYQKEVREGRTEHSYNERYDLLTYRILEEIFATCNQRQWPLVVLSVGIEGQRIESIRTLMQKHRVPYIIVPFVRERPELYYKTDWHWNAQGHQFVASQILDALAGSLDHDQSGHPGHTSDTGLAGETH